MLFKIGKQLIDSIALCLDRFYDVQAKQKRIENLAPDLQEVIDYVNGVRQRSVYVYSKALIFSNMFKSTVERRHHRPILPQSLCLLSTTSHKQSFVCRIIDDIPFFGIPYYFFRLSIGYW
jgi:hypothetical protein